MKKLRELIQQLLGDPRSRRLLAGASAAAVLLLLSGVAYAAEGHGGHHGQDHINWWGWDDHAPPVGWFLLDFAIFVGLLVYFTKRPFTEMFQKRHDTVKASIEEAQAAHNKALAFQKEYKEKLARVDQEAKALIEGAKKDGAEERDEIIESAQEYAERLRKDTSSVVDQEVELARERLRQELVEEVLRLAQSRIEKELDDDDRRRLLEQAISDLENGATDLRDTARQRRAG